MTTGSNGENGALDLSSWMAQWNMFPPPGGTVLCAVSGGRDSMCLLHYLHRLGAERGFTVAAGHLNHGMRPTAARDEDFVRAFCQKQGIPFYVEHVRVYEQAAAWDLSVEETGRRLRYAFLERTADAIGAARIATAHHRGDQAETVLLHLLRGTGPEGLGGIPPVRGRLIRPLLDTPRPSIEEYLRRWGIGHVEDETNADCHYARNRLRLELWPELEQIHGGAEENIARAALLIRRESAYLDELAAARLPAGGTAVACRELLDAPEALRGRMLRLLIDRLGCGKKDLGAVHLTALERLASGEGMLDLPGGVQAVCRCGMLTLCRAAPGNEEVWLTPEIPVRWGDYTVTLTAAAAPESAVALDGAAARGAVSVRSWRSGDALTLPGSRGGRSLKRLMTEAGIPPERRPAAPVLCVDGRAAAVYGIGTDQAFLPQPNGETVYITFQETDHGGEQV